MNLRRIEYNHERGKKYIPSGSVIAAYISNYESCRKWMHYYFVSGKIGKGIINVSSAIYLHGDLTKPYSIIKECEQVDDRISKIVFAKLPALTVMYGSGIPCANNVGTKDIFTFVDKIKKEINYYKIYGGYHEK